LFFLQKALFLTFIMNILICPGLRIERRKLGGDDQRLGDIRSSSVELQELIANGDILPLERRRDPSTQARWRDDRRPADERVAKSSWTQSRQARAVNWQKRKGARSSSEALGDCKGEKGGAQYLREHQEKCSELSKALIFHSDCLHLTINNRALLCFIFALKKALFRLCTLKIARLRLR
jgi:hypothetical protein